MSTSTIAIVFASVVVFACRERVTTVVGRWEPVQLSDGGIGSVWDFRDDGTVTSGAVVQVNFSYSLEEGKLVFPSVDSERTKGRIVEFSADGEAMLFDGVPARWRVGLATPGMHPIVGLWTYEHYTKLPAYERFGADGIVELRIPMLNRSIGRYTVSHTTLRIEFEGAVTVFSFGREGDLLRLTKTDDRPRRFRLVSRWYPFPVDDAEDAGRVLTRDSEMSGIISREPQFLSFGLVHPGTSVVRSVKLDSQDPQFDLSNVSVTLEGNDGKPLQWAEHFSTAIKPTLGKNAVEVELCLYGWPEGSDGSFSGVMVVKTGHPSKPQEVVGFVGACRALTRLPTSGAPMDGGR